MTRWQRLRWWLWDIRQRLRGGDDGLMCWHDESQRLTEADKAARIVWPGKDDT